MEQLKIVALDPGRTTGWAVGIIEDGLMKVTSGQEAWSHYQLWSQLHVSEPDIIVCESFEFRQRSRAGLDLFSRELIGVIELYVQYVKEGKLVDSSHRALLPPPKLTMQTAAKGKGYYTDTLLKKHNIHRPGKPHANDAMRHLLHWFTFGSGYQYNTKGFERL